MTQYRREVEAIAREAGTLLLSHFTRRITFEYKGDVDLVTEADRASETLIAGHLRARWPEYGIVGEEGTRTAIGAEYRWYVDPLDGTTNFAHAYPVFNVTLALEKAGELITGVVFDPYRDELF